MSSATSSEHHWPVEELEALASSLLRPEPIIWVWTEQLGARPWAGNGNLDVDGLAEALYKISPDFISDTIIYFLAPVVPGEQE